MEKKLIDSLGGAMFCANRNFYQNSWRIQRKANMIPIRDGGRFGGVYKVF